jgi:hypothetical protein
VKALLRCFDRIQTLLPGLLAVILLGSAGAPAQEPAQPSPPAPSAQPVPPVSETPAPSSKPHANQGKKPLPGFLIIGSVFNEKTLSFPGVQVRVRRAEEKKYRWEAETNARGEFAVRVPDGHEYEVLVYVKNYQGQTRKFSTNNGDIQQRLSFRMEPTAKEKSGVKP